ncbi:MAG: Gfo/Idh/MocA family oxidoreductase, partial [Gammaproteobacteria bacterium]|nr:Gfo/Idh/MocA family oxidoreductase [Gammaproteobacteria bacterium]
VEKPMALDVENAKQLCRLADNEGRVLMVGHLLQYHPAFLKLTEIVRTGTLGKLQYIYSNRLNLGKVRREENILWSFAPHDVSMILSLVGEEPIDVRAVGTSYRERGNADVTTTHLIFPGGVRAHVFVSWLHPFKEQKLVVIGEAGMAVFDDGEAWDRKVLLYPHTIDWIEGTPHPSRANPEPHAIDECEPLRLECEHFLDCLAKGIRPRTDGEEGVRVLRVLKAAQDALDREHDPAPFNRLQDQDMTG